MFDPLSGNHDQTIVKVKVKLLSRVWLFATPWTVTHQAPPFMGISRQEYWSGLPCLPCHARPCWHLNLTITNGLIKEGFTFPRILQQIQSHQLLLSFCLAMSCHGTCDLMLTKWPLHLWPSEGGGRGKAVGKKQKRTNRLCHLSLPLQETFVEAPPCNFLLILLVN